MSKYYLATYLSTDGEFHDAGDACFSYLFRAKTDEEAQTLALAYAKIDEKRRHTNFRYELTHLSRVEFIDVSVDTERVVSITHDLEKRVMDACFHFLERG